MGAAHLPDDSRGKVSLEVLTCATMLEGLRMITVRGKIKTDQHIHGKNQNGRVTSGHGEKLEFQMERRMERQETKASL